MAGFPVLGTCGGDGGKGRISSGGDSRGKGEKGSGGVVRKSSKLSMISILVISQTTSAAISYRFSGQSSLSKGLFVSTLATNLLGYLSISISILMMPELAKLKEMIKTAEILGGIGIVACALGFIQMIAMSLLVLNVMLLNHTMPKVKEILGWIGIVASSCLAFYTNDSFVPLCKYCLDYLHRHGRRLRDLKIKCSSSSEG